MEEEIKSSESTVKKNEEKHSTHHEKNIHHKSEHSHEHHSKHVEEQPEEIKHVSTDQIKDEHHRLSEPKKHTSSHTHHSKKTETVQIKKETIWKIISGILALVLIFVVFTNGGADVKANSISSKEAEDKALDYINNNLLQPGTVAEVEETVEENGMYKIKLNIDGQTFDSYVSTDGEMLFPSGVPLDGSAPARPSEPTPPPTADLDMDKLMDDDAVKGDADAPVTIIEWSDFECPFCARFYSQTYGQIVEKYIETGKVKLIFRDFPLGFHANAQKAAEAAECAGEQGKFYEMHDLLFEEGVTGGVESFKKMASELKLDTNDFDECLDSGAMASEVQKDMADGQAAGISGTPGFIINGRLVSGAQPFSAFEQIIEEELAK